MTARDPTFSKFSADQGKAYAASRGIQYPPPVYEEILKYHDGETKLALDIGCGPGNVTRDLVKYFDKVIGLDNGPGMVEAAQSFISEDQADKISFAVCPAESIDTGGVGIKAGSVDVITSAVAIHWFDLPKFYNAASAVLKPGGTIAAWIGAQAEASPSCAQASQIKAIFTELSAALQPYKMPANILADNQYDDLPLPWTTEPPSREFDKASYKRVVFCLENGNALMKSYPLGLDRLEQSIHSASPYIRWSEANPDLIGTDNDIAKVHVNKMKEVLGEGVNIVDVEVKMILIMFKKLL